jgi:acyl-CoA dehydrogenase
VSSIFPALDDYADVLADAKAVAAAVEPIAEEVEESGELDPRVVDALAQSGLGGLMVPARYGGRFDEVDPVAVCIVREVFMPVCGQLDSVFALQGIGSFAISRAGTEEQRDEWLPRVRRLEALAALALTEPDVGSDLKNISTEVVEEDGALLLNGHKSFISNAGVAAFYTVLAQDGDDQSLLLVPADTPGIDIVPGPVLAAPHVIGDVRFRDVRLPVSGRIGNSGDGMDLVLATLATFRVSVAAAAVGLAQAALDEAVVHANAREAFGRPLARLGAVAAMLADTWTDVEMARLFTYRAAELARQDPAANIHYSSMAKVSATEAAGRAVDRTVQIMGRFGLVRGSKIERLSREVRPMRVYEGASEVLRLGIARALTEATRSPTG